MDRLAYIGHATTLLRLGETSILTDPMLRDWLGPLHRQGPSPDPQLGAAAGLGRVSHLPPAPPPDRQPAPAAYLVLISPPHRAPLDVRSLRRVPETTPIVAPAGARRWVS